MMPALTGGAYCANLTRLGKILVALDTHSEAQGKRNNASAIAARRDCSELTFLEAQASDSKLPSHTC